ncbi:MAG: D-alanyl-D-alanine carboxypeptidase [Clostridia bacterium]|nr:D-alanyl-D-alanine carboxypeptidase [Clostridia bacterium]
MNKKILIAIIIFLICFFNPIKISFAQDLQITADKVILMEAETGKILYKKNAYIKSYPASTTKILTAILALENSGKNEIVVPNDDVLNINNGSSRIYLNPGEKMSVEQLLYALMLPSGNDAAIALADHVSESIESFVTLMNYKSKELGANNTHFVNPHGFHDPDHYTTAYDMAIIARYALKNHDFRKIISTYKYVLPPTNKFDQERRWINTNKLINPESKEYYPKSTGIKTGYTSVAKNCLVASASNDNMELIAVILGCEKDMFSQARALFEYGFEHYKKLNIVNKNKIIETVEVYGSESKTVDIATEEDIIDVFPKENSDSIYHVVDIKDDITAPIKKGEILGRVTYHIGNENRTVNLIALNDVEKKNLINIVKPKKELSIPAWVLIILILIYIPLRIYIAIRRKIRKARKIRRF